MYNRLRNMFDRGKNMAQKIILTGDRPTGKLHVGHYVGSLKRRVELQNSGEYDKIFIMIADAQALTDNADNPAKVRSNIMEVALDYLSVGIDPAKSNIFIQSYVTELTELTFYYMNLVTVSRLQRNPTVKSEIQMRNFETSIPVGFFCYPISQAADITAFHATTVPVGEDQMPMLEQTKEIVHKFNAVYGETLTDPQILLPENKACLRLPGTDGKAKMSKSLGNCIYLSEPEADVKKKIMSMYTDPNHIRIEDPGNLEGNTVFTYLDAFCNDGHFAEYLPEYSCLQELKDHYTRGGLGDVKVKKFLNNVMQEELSPIRARRKEYENRIGDVYDILKKGSETAGYVVTVTDSDGYGGDIKFTVGISTDGKVLGVSFLSISETAGLGMRAKQDPSFTSQFTAKSDAVASFSVVTDGSASESNANVDAIGGSTVTSKAITKGVNAALAVYAAKHVKEQY